MKITKNGKELAEEKYSLETPKYKEIFESDEAGLYIKCEDDCEITCYRNDCKIECWHNCKIECTENCKITSKKGTEINYYYNGKYLIYKFKESKTILCKDGELVEQ